MKVDSKVCWLFLFAVGLMAILLARPALAQEGKVDLTLRLVPDIFYNEVTAGKDNIFYLEIRNTGSKAVTNIRLSADKPEGWVIQFRPGEVDYLGPGSLQTVDVNIKPDGEAVKGDYRVTLIAEANEIRKVTSIWVRVVTASFWPIDLTLALTCGDYRYYNEATAGKDNQFFLEVRNTGSKAVTNIRLSADKPEGWVIEFKPAVIDYLGAGSLQTVDVNIKPDRTAVKRGYSFTLIAEANEIRKVEQTWVTVVGTPRSFWLWVGGIVGFIVVAAFVAIFLRFGRQQNSEP